jgi:hypothetical protein
MTYEVPPPGPDSVKNGRRPGEPPTCVGDGKPLLRPPGKQAFALDENVGQGTAHFDEDGAIDDVTTAPTVRDLAHFALSARRTPRLKQKLCRPRYNYSAQIRPPRGKSRLLERRHRCNTIEDRLFKLHHERRAFSSR